jgi:PAS domain S-box-containing protein
VVALLPSDEKERLQEVLRGSSSQAVEQRKKRVRKDLWVIFVLTVFVFIIGNHFGFFDSAFHYIESHDRGLYSYWNEAAGTLGFVCLALLVFSYRRWKESRAETLSETQISKALSILHKELEEQVRQRTAELVQTNEDLRNEIVERQRAEAIIKQFPAIIESSDDAIISKTLDGIITSWNPAAERMFGYMANEIIGKPITLLIPAGRVQEEKEMLAHIAKGERVQHFETIRVRKDGRRFDVSATISPIKDVEGKVAGVSIIIRDVTERKRVEARFRRMVDSNAQGVFFWNTKGEIIGANDAFLRLVRYSREDLEAGRIAWAAMTPPEYADLDRRGLAEVAANGVCTPYEKEFIRKDGSRVPIFIGAAVFEDNPDEGVCSVVDLTEIKLAMKQIVEQAALLDKARDAILVRDLEGNILFWNKGAERMYGWTRQEIVGRNMGALCYANPKIFEEANELVIGQGEWHGELQHLTKDGHGITIEARWTLIRDNDGQPKSVLAINTDITDRKKIEAQFMRAQRMESIGTLAGGIAHDLNNILAPIMMSIDILRSSSDSPQTTQILETIQVSAKRGADIVRQVLSFARGLEGERIEVQPKHLLKDLENIIKDTFPKDIRLQFSIPNETWTILGDPTQIHQILLNLCVNARDAMPNGGNLTVAVENCMIDEQYAAMNLQAKPGRYVNISVTDSGTGIPPAILDKIFEPFFTTKELNKGTGLGLSTVMAIIKSHDGFVNVYSEPGQGTTFKVYLPAMEVSSEARKEQSEAASLPRGNGELILVVDDEASILTITVRTLQAFGYQVLTATDGAHAVAVYAQHEKEIAVVLTDMMMPVMDGPAMIHALMRMNPAVKIVAASGLNANGSTAKASGAGVKHFLMKPYTAGTLLKTMRAILDEA